MAQRYSLEFKETEEGVLKKVIKVKFYARVDFTTSAILLEVERLMRNVGYVESAIKEGLRQRYQTYIGEEE